VLDLPLSTFIQTFLETTLGLNELDVAEKVKGEFIFTISLLDATIQDGGIRERSNVHQIFSLTTFKIYSLFQTIILFSIHNSLYDNCILGLYHFIFLKLAFGGKKNIVLRHYKIQ